MTVEQLQGGTDELDPVEPEIALVTAPVIDVERRIEILAGVPEVESDPSLVQIAAEGSAQLTVGDEPAVADPLVVVDEPAVADPLVVVEGLAAEPAGEPIANDEPTAGEAPQASAESLVAFESPVATGISVWPFVAYDAVWLVFAGLAIWQLLDVPSGVAVYDAEIYPLVLVAGIALTATGPALVFASWFAARGRSEEGPVQLFVSALLRGAVSTSIGVALWWSVLIAVDRVRLGSFF